MAVVGHFTIGIKSYLNPILATDIDPVLKKIFQSMFHYASAFMVISTFFLIRFSFEGCRQFESPDSVAKFVSIIYALFAVSQFKKSQLDKSPIKIIKKINIKYLYVFITSPLFRS